MTAPPTPPSAAPQPDVAAAIDATTRALAGWIIERHLKKDPTLGHRYAQCLTDWRGDIAVRLANLAEAVHFGEPALFLEHVAWAKAAFGARGIPTSDLETSLAATGEVLRDELPPPAPAVVGGYIEAALAHVRVAPSELNSELSARAGLDDVLNQYLLHALEGRRREACELIHQSVRAGTPVLDIYEKVLARAQIEVGRMWHMGEINVAQEHHCTQTTSMVMAQLNPQLAVKPRTQKTVVLTSVGGDTHVMGLRMVADYFEMAGWTPVYLGASTPAPDLVESVGAFRADVLALAAKMTVHLRPLQHTIRHLREHPATRKIPILVGGSPFMVAPGLGPKVGADAVARSATDAVEAAERLVPGDRPSAEVPGRRAGA